jgi:hypothetical protein
MELAILVFFSPANRQGKGKNATVLKGFYYIASEFEKINLFVRSLPADGGERAVKNW